MKEVGIMVMYEATCIVCGETVWWDRDSTLPPACNQHEYIEVYEAAEPAVAADRDSSGLESDPGHLDKLT